MVTHLRATRPTEISFTFKNGVSRVYLLTPAAGPKEVGRRQMRRRARAAVELVYGAMSVDLSS